MEIKTCLEQAGAVVVGPASTVDAAAALAGTEDLDATVLDVNLHGRSVAPAANTLQEWDIPVVFTTGYEHLEDLPAMFAATSEAGSSRQACGVASGRI